jgi:hypothetical protein
VFGSIHHGLEYRPSKVRNLYPTNFTKIMNELKYIGSILSNLKNASLESTIDVTAHTL